MRTLIISLLALILSGLPTVADAGTSTIQRFFMNQRESAMIGIWEDESATPTQASLKFVEYVDYTANEVMVDGVVQFMDLEQAPNLGLDAWVVIIGSFYDDEGGQYVDGILAVGLKGTTLYVFAWITTGVLMPEDAAEETVAFFDSGVVGYTPPRGFEEKSDSMFEI